MLISSKMTFFYKRIFPALFLGFVFVFAVISIGVGVASGQSLQILPFVALPAIMGVFAYLMFKFLLFDLVDEVIDEGDRLVIRNGPQTEHVSLANIMNVNSSVFINPPRITLMLRKPSAFGKNVSFMPPRRFSFKGIFAPHPLAEDLIYRIDRQRTGR